MTIATGTSTSISTIAMITTGDTAIARHIITIVIAIMRQW
jgi:hypothetical protein